jgi:hypothetical protein
MIEYRGSGLIWDGLSLWGKKEPPPGTGARANIGIKIVQPSSGPITTGKIWAPSIMIDDCFTAIYADGRTRSADSCAFGYAWIRSCETCFHLDGANATMFTFGYVHPLISTTVFKVTGGGRIYVQSLNVLTQFTTGTILDVSGGDIPNGFFHINGVTGDGNITDYHLLKNTDSGNGLTHVRFTNAHLTPPHGDPIKDFNAKIDINRSASTSGQTVVEIVGCRGLNAMVGTPGSMTDPPNVVIKGASSSRQSHLIIRGSELARSFSVVDANNSSHYTENRIKNWLFGSGLETDLP